MFEERRTDDVKRLQEDVAENIVVQISPTLDATEGVSFAGITVVEINLI